MGIPNNIMHPSRQKEKGPRHDPMRAVDDERWTVEMNDAFAHLDRALLAACDHEERRAALLAAGGAAGWEGVRNLARPPVAELLHSEEKPPPIPLPGHDAPPALLRLAEAFALSSLELTVLLLVLAPHVEPRYRTLYGVLQDAMAEPWATERLLLTVLGRTPARRRELLETLAPCGQLRETGLITLSDGQPPGWAMVDSVPAGSRALHPRLSLSRPHPQHEA